MSEPRIDSPETTSPNIGGIPIELGFHETDLLADLHTKWVNAIKTDNTQGQRVIGSAYVAQGKKILEVYGNLEEEEVGYRVQVALILQEGGAEDKYLRVLEEAWKRAENAGLENIASRIQEELYSKSSQQ